MEPQTRLGNAALTAIAYGGTNLAPFSAELTRLCEHRTMRAGALMDLSAIAQLRGDRDLGLQYQSDALTECRFFRTHGSSAPRKVLLVYAMAGDMGSNTPIEFLLQGNSFDIITYYHPAGAGPVTLPPHDVAFCAAPADSDVAEVFFESVRRVSRRAAAPVLNLPKTLVKPTRDTLPKLFEDVPGLRVPKTISMNRTALLEALRSSDEGEHLGEVGDYPYVVRPTGSHAGLGLRKINTRAEFIAYLQARDEATFFVSEFINYASSSDGAFRKYRIVLVDGQPFPCHMAISDQWDVWYMNANMAASEAKRADEAAFMEGFAHGMGQRHKRAFQALADGLDLDYFGIDCAEDSDGNLVVFEADNALIVHDMDCEVTFPYKLAPMASIFAAFEAMLLGKCPKVQPHAVARPPVEILESVTLHAAE